MAKVRYTAKYATPDGTIDRKVYTFDAADDTTASGMARVEAERLSRSGTVTWDLRTASGRRVTR